MIFEWLASRVVYGLEAVFLESGIRDVDIPHLPFSTVISWLLAFDSALPVSEALFVIGLTLTIVGVLLVVTVYRTVKDLIPFV